MAKRRSSTQPTGFVLIDKPVGPSSNAAVQTVRRTLGIGGRKGTKGGHAGTLDPFASGLLIVLLGHATKLMPYVVGHEKRYLVGVTFGASSDTDDSTGELVEADAPLPTLGAVRAACAELAASTRQVPPAVSALHIDGTRAYARVRAGETVVVAARSVRFDAIDLVDSEPCVQTPWIRSVSEQGSEAPVHHVRLDVRCGTGTYMRALARDLGELVGCPAHCSSLRRTEVGDWPVTGAVPPDAVTLEHVQPVDELALMPQLTISDEHLDHILQGRAFSVDAEVATDVVLAMSESGGPLAVLAREAGGRVRTTTLLVDSPSIASE